MRVTCGYAGLHVDQSMFVCVCECVCVYWMGGGVCIETCCGVTVPQSCYGVLELPDGDDMWLCTSAH
jgi:hypothetical protein